jgi:hypothetical protein
MSDNLANWLLQTKEKTLYINTETEKVKNGTATFQERIVLAQTRHEFSMYLNITKYSYEYHKRRKLNTEEEIIFAEAELAILKSEKEKVEISMIDQMLRIEEISKQDSLTEEDKNEVQVLIDELNVIRSGANLIDQNMLSEEANYRLSIMDSILLFGRNTIKGLKPKSNDIFRQAEIYIK